VGVLYNLRIAIEEKIKADGLDAADIKGKIGLRTGRLMVLVSPSTPDDPASIAKFRLAAKEILNLNL
jgi:hypothetical protein